MGHEDEDITETAAAVDAGSDAATIEQQIETYDIDGVALPLALRRCGRGESSVVVLEDALRIADSRATTPRRRIGTARIAELDSFTEHVNRYKSAATLIWADVEAMQLTAVYNEHPEGALDITTGWRDFRAVYTCPRSPEWLAWTAADGKAMHQDAFADFLEARLEDLIGGDGFPKPVDMLQMARDLVVRSKGTFERKVDVTNGNNILVNKTETDTGSTVIPRSFLIGVPVFEGGSRYQVEARIRFALIQGTPSFAFVLHRRREVERDAFGDVRSKAAAATELPVYAGKP